MVEPGCGIDISATFEAENQTGYKRRNIVLRTDDPAKDIVVLTFEGEVVARYAAEPAIIELTKDHISQTFRIRPNCDGDIGSVETVFCNVPGVTVTQLPATEGAVEFCAAAKIPFPSGTLSGYVLVEVNSDGAKECVFIGLQGVLSERYHSVPQEVVFDKNNIGVVRLRGFRSEDITAKQIKLPDASLEVIIDPVDEDIQLTLVATGDAIDFFERPLIVEGLDGSLVIPIRRE